jgi:hypothetical protein
MISITVICKRQASVAERLSRSRLPEQGRVMFAADQYRPRASQHQETLDPPGPLNRTREFRRLQRTYTTLAGKEDLRPAGNEKMPSGRRKYRDNHAGVAEEEEEILKCLGAAVIMRWNTLPTKLQRELFEHADSIGDMYQAASLREPIARFLHDHKDDEQEMRRRKEPMRNATAKERHAITLDAGTHVEEARKQRRAADVLDELWRFSCEMPDAPHLNTPFPWASCATQSS